MTREMSRRDFLIGAGALAAGTALSQAVPGRFTRAQEATAEVDPYAQSDAANRRALTAIDRKEQPQITLDHPRIVGYLEYREDVPLLPDRDKVRAVIGDSEGVYGFVSNVNCTLEFAKPYLGERVELDRTDDEFNVYFHPVVESNDLPYGLRIEQTVGRALDDEVLPLLDGEMRATHYALDEVTHNGQTMACPDLVDQAKETLGEAREQAGETIEELREGADELGGRLRDWWNSR